MSTTTPTPSSAAPSLLRALREPLLIGLLALTLNLAGNGATGLWDRDEPRYAVCVREMRARNDWVFPTYNAEPRYHKPVLIYWLMRAGVALFGDNPFGMRLVSGVAGAGTCVLVWGLGRRMFGPQVGRLAALILATAPIMLVESKMATTDATLTFWLVAGQFCLWELSRRPSRWLAALFWLLLALGILTKGPVPAALIAAAGLVSWRLGGPTACWKRLHWKSGLAIVAAVTLPWLVAIGVLSRGEFYRVAVGFHVVQRVTTGLEEHGGFPGYYIALSLLTFYPWSALLPPALHGAWTRRRDDPALGFLLGWIVGPLIVLELVRTKLIHYYLPAFPACALLVAWLVVTLVREEVALRRWPLGRTALGLLTSLGIVLVVALAAAAVVSRGPSRWPCLFMAAAVAAGTLSAALGLSRGATGKAVARLVATWGVVGLALGGWLAPSAAGYQFSRRVGERLAAISARSGVEPVLLTFQEPSTVYALGRPVVLLRVWEDMYDQIGRHGEVLTALRPNELRFLRSLELLDIEAEEEMSGFNLSKGETQGVTFARLRARPSCTREDWLAARPAPGELVHKPDRSRSVLLRISRGDKQSLVK